MKFLKPVLLTIFMVSLTACNFDVRQPTVHSEQQAQQEIQQVQETSPDIEKANEEKSMNDLKQYSWLLVGEDGIDEYVQFLINLNDPSGKSFIRIDDLIDAMQTKEERIKYKDSQIDVRRITEDGGRIAIIRDVHENHRLVIQVYNLNSGEKENEYEMPMGAIYPLVSPDLSKYIYEMNGQVFLCDLNNNQITKENINISNLYSGEFSPDGSKFSFTDDGKGIVLLDLSNQKMQRVLTNTKVEVVNKWDTANQLIFTVAENNERYQGNIYSFNLHNENKRWLGKYLFTSMLSPDNKKLIYGDPDEIETYIMDVRSEEKRDVSKIIASTGSWTKPLQWIDTTVDYMKYSNIVEVKRLSASSTLVDQVYPNVDTKNLTDDNNLTAWCEGVPGNGEGETITIDLGDTQKVRGLEVINGYNDSLQNFEENNQVEKMRLEFSDGSTIELENFDIRTIFDEPVETSFIKITILEVQPGTKYQNTCVSELKVL